MCDDWVVCSPGDITDAHHKAICEVADGDHYCAHQWNPATDSLRVEVTRGEHSDYYTINRYGEVTDGLS